MKLKLFTILIVFVVLSGSILMDASNAKKVIFFNPNKTQVDEASLFTVIRRCLKTDHRGRCRH